MKAFLYRHRLIVGMLAAVVALGVAILYFFIVPNEAAATTGVARAILLYGHSVCWGLLMAAGVSWALDGPRRLTAGLAYGALAVYAAFMATVVLF